MLGKYIDAKTFILSLAIGLFLVYLTKPIPKIIYIYPTPSNINNIKYKDKAGNCFKFRANEVQCPSDKKLIKSIPFQ